MRLDRRHSSICRIPFDEAHHRAGGLSVAPHFGIFTHFVSYAERRAYHAEQPCVLGRGHCDRRQPWTPEERNRALNARYALYLEPGVGSAQRRLVKVRTSSHRGVVFSGKTNGLQAVDTLEGTRERILVRVPDRELQLGQV